MFITFEGTEGSGKSTQARLLYEYLESIGKSVVLTREPGWGKLGSIIRELILDDKQIKIDPFAELCLFCADRAQHVREFIKPKLNEGFIVICDRYSDSTHIYQGYGRKLDINLVKEMADSSRLDLIPNLTFFLSIPVAEGLERLKSRGEITKIDAEPLDFHNNILAGYKKLIKDESERFKVIRASGSIENTHNEIKEAISSIL
ncbi:MAG: dTMP kinase [Candidatus Dadabacteria bacterium]|nr:dTMP kinase [Candidatus Dadabacteria bacterium]NIQ14989.1 dTMP kinase [Candidatus Dadabacteria bacterium]